MVGHGGPWWAMVGHGGPWWAMVGYGWLWLAMVGYGWLWLTMVGYGWLWLAMVGYGWLCLLPPVAELWLWGGATAQPQVEATKGMVHIIDQCDHALSCFHLWLSCGCGVGHSSATGGSN